MRARGFAGSLSPFDDKLALSPLRNELKLDIFAGFCYRKIESRSRSVTRFQGSVQSVADALRKRKKRTCWPFFHAARRMLHAPCLLATARNRVASSHVGLAAEPPLTWIRMKGLTPMQDVKRCWANVV